MILPKCNFVLGFFKKQLCIYLFVYCLFIFKTRSQYVALACMGLMEHQTGLKLNSSPVDSVFRVLGLQACAWSLVTTHYPRDSGE